ncbi:MAG: dockerin type I domain-containing protein [Acutalibacteraceae bacterium]
MKSKLRKVTAVLLAVVMTLCALCVGTVSAGAAGDIENVEVEIGNVRDELQEYVDTLSLIDLFPKEYWYQIYEEEAFDAYFATVEKAKALLADENATDEELEAMIDELNAADEMLSHAIKYRPMLEMVVENSSWIDEEPIEDMYEMYGQENVDAFIAARDKAQALLADENATDEELKAMIEELLLAQNNLYPAVDVRTQLESMVEASSWVDEESVEFWYQIYGQESFDAYLAAVEKAKALLADENATDEELEAMIDELMMAEENLYGPRDIRGELEMLVDYSSWVDDETVEYWYEIYTKESFDAYLAAIEKAKALLADENATDEELEAMIDELTAAEGSLITIGGPSFSGGKIYWECPWSNVRAAYCHVFSSDGDWLYDWQTKYERMTNEGGNLWSYEIPEGPYDLVIFSVNTGAQTYELVLTDENIGDTAISDFKVMLENPMDENKTSPKTTWKSGVNGAHLTITSTGNIVGDKLCPTESGADAVAYFIGIYLPIQPLYVTSEVLKNAMNKFGTNQAEIVDVLEREFIDEADLLSDAKTLLGYVEGVSGDVTGDGKVSLTDAICVQKVSLSMKRLTSKTALTGDVNGDDRISVIDAILIQKKSLGMAA